MLRAFLVFAVAASAVGTIDPPRFGLPLDMVQLVAVAAAAVAAIAYARFDRDAAPPPVPASTAAGIAAAAAAAVLGTALPPASPASAAAPILMAAGAVLVGGPLMAFILQGLVPGRRAQAALDALTVALAAACVMAPLWFAVATSPFLEAPFRVAGAVATLVVAAPLAASLALVDRRLKPGLWGPWASVLGVLLGGAAVLGDLRASAVLPVASPGAAAAFLSAGSLLLAWGTVTWWRAPASGPRWDRVAQLLVDAVPAVAVGLALLSALASDGKPHAAAAHGLSFGVVVVALVRQVHLVRRERRTAEAELRAAQRLTREVRRRAEMAAWLASFDARPTAEETAARICEGMASVEGVGEAVVVAFEADGTSRILGEAGPVSLVEAAGPSQPEAMTRYFRERAAGGAWEEALRDRSDPHAILLAAGGLDWVANAPISHGGELLGRLSISTPGEDQPELRRERLVTAGELGAIASAILGPSLAERARREAARREIADIIEGWAFRTVFQPIVDLSTRRLAGHEALTRFEDGRRPDLRFAEAEAVGLGLDLEVATLESAVLASGRVPRATYLSLNVSPTLAVDLGRVRRLVDRLACPVVLEVTERDAVASYDELRSSLAALRGLVRIAVDDVGAGYAGLRHILEIAPDLLKLDIALVRGVDQDAAKRALIRGILSFAAEAGSKIVAEGVETPDEARVLAELGVDLAQGYLFGRPDRLDQTAVDAWLKGPA
ncbi:MAG: EAL domain-containing protein [Chloroflexota bacterium]